MICSRSSTAAEAGAGAAKGVGADAGNLRVRCDQALRSVQGLDLAPLQEAEFYRFGGALLHGIAIEIMAAYTDPLLTFIMLLAAIYGVTVALYFIYGLGITWLNNRNPERRIQKTRRGEKRMWAEIRQSMISILVTSTSVAFGLFAQIMGWAPTPWTLTWWNALPLFFLCMVISDLWFYAAHRLLHTKLFYKHHAWHHRSVAPTAWSHDSMTVVDTALCQAHHTLMVFLIPFPPPIILANRAYDQINGTFGHAGFEYFASPTSRFPSPMLCVFFHDQHHSEFRYNYGNYFSFWDRIFGTIAPDYDQRVKAMEGEDLPLRPLTDKVRHPAE